MQRHRMFGTVLRAVLSALLMSACAGRPTAAPMAETADVVAVTATATDLSPTVTAPTPSLPPATPPATSTLRPSATSTRQPPATLPSTPPAPTATSTSTPPPTPAPQLTPPVILSFTADRTDIAERETVVLHWKGTGATSAAIWWFDAHAMPSPPVEINGDPNDGSASINPDASPIHLTLRNAAGETEAMVELNIHCVYAWIPELAGNPYADRCPQEPIYTLAAQQAFENGFMIWLANEAVIYVFYNSGVQGPTFTGPYFHAYADRFREGDPENDPTLVPPEGRYQPVRGFGLVWRTETDVRTTLGWAIAPESGGETWAQRFSGVGRYASYQYLKGLDGRIYFMQYLDGRWGLYP
ncbi:MAG: hypothetical protein GYA30_11980 [Chloroflexi bacterium]|nr:hypothetical protein [Chloroflexota bacterium]